MCHSEPTIYGMSLILAMEIEDGVPDCCGDEMDSRGPDEDGHRIHTCSCCGTIVEVDELGLVWDIREKTAA